MLGLRNPVPSRGSFGNGGGSMVGLVAAQQAAIVTFAASFQRCASSRRPDTSAVARTCPCKCGGRNSFGAGTLVLTKEGLVPIEDVRVGQLVGAWNPDTGGLRWQPVKARSMREAPSVMRLTVRDDAGRVETVVVTPNHPYLRGDGALDLLRAVTMEPRGELASRWTGAGFLSVGDTVQSASGGTLTVVASEVELGPIQVYNFEVAGDHTYAVGQLQAWVHNAKSPPPAPGRPTPANTGGLFKPGPGSSSYRYHSQCDQKGWLDQAGNVWVPQTHGGTHGPHWDVQQKGGGYKRVYPPRK